MFVVLLMMAPPSQELEPPANPGRFNANVTLHIGPAKRTALERLPSLLEGLIPQEDADSTQLAHPKYTLPNSCDDMFERVIDSAGGLADLMGDPRSLDDLLDRSIFKNHFNNLRLALHSAEAFADHLGKIVSLMRLCNRISKRTNNDLDRVRKHYTNRINLLINKFKHNQAHFEYVLAEATISRGEVKQHQFHLGFAIYKYGANSIELFEEVFEYVGGPVLSFSSVLWLIVLEALGLADRIERILGDRFVASRIEPRITKAVDGALAALARIPWYVFDDRLPNYVLDLHPEAASRLGVNSSFVGSLSLPAPPALTYTSGRDGGQVLGHPAAHGIHVPLWPLKKGLIPWVVDA